jgi:hypothetical protein
MAAGQKVLKAGKYPLKRIESAHAKYQFIRIFPEELTPAIGTFLSALRGLVIGYKGVIVSP